MTIASLLLAFTTFAAPLEVNIKTLEGQTQTGRLTALSKESLSLETSDGCQTFQAAELMSVDLPAASALAEKPTVWIELVDGSKLQATSYSAAFGKSRIDLTCGQTVEVPTRGIHTVRFRQQSAPELAIQWREIVSSLATGDIIVVRKTSTQTVEQGDNEPATVAQHALDQLEGAVHDVTADSVRFSIDGETIDVRRDKLEGLVYRQPAKREFPPPACRLIDAGGSTWLLADVNLSGDRISGPTLGNVSIDLPLAAVSKVDFSAGNVVFLSDLEPDSGDGDLAVSLQPAAMTYKFGRVFKTRAAPPLGADAFRIGGSQFDGGLSLHSPLTLVYRVPQGFRWFRAVSGVDDSVVAPGRFDLIILGDGKELARHAFSGESAAVSRQPLPIDLDVSGVRRISIVLDPADGQDIGDQLNLCEARFTK